MTKNEGEGRFVINSATILHTLLVYMIVFGTLKLLIPGYFSQIVFKKMEDFDSIRILGGCMLGMAWITWPFRLIGE
jgi:hypothetical protein